MRLGYAWKFGPFELIDQLGPGNLAKALKAAGRPVPPFLETLGERSCYRVEAGQLQAFGLDGAYHDVVRPEGVLLLADVKRRSKPILKNGSAALWDIGDGVACFEFTSKMNSIDPDLLGLLGKSIALVAQKFKALVIYNEGSNFSVGANLGLAMFAVNICAWDQVKGMVELGQGTYRALREAPFPVVGAPSGMALGGGCEILMHCAAVQAHAESYVGLVEVGVGLLPGWGGCATLLGRWTDAPGMPHGPMPPIAKAFEMISTAKVAKSAMEAKESLLLPHDAGVTMNRDRLLFDAKAKALSMVGKHEAPARRTYRLPGPTGMAALTLALDGFVQKGDATAHDRVVCLKLAEVLTGGDADVTEEISEDAILAMERKNFMSLVRHPGSMARIEHMLETGKPLRN
jgi:3-hydroxyacyl-CoA dehydrogenase